ncbi:outer membrane beta-barrel protein [Grimontia kaedaensis]|uniref:Outer membrane beta-barrel protein n=1 Tax=Grimontia kaedaensis TaxID=2872157 RepID=A0ABY4X2P9_9GAMM|nr:outer membrane beta-barrel protein [Grimontia kaedaensis]USH05519.1 outer membrane beta-barrel protein [Grimontia kaedaensis]
MISKKTRFSLAVLAATVFSTSTFAEGVYVTVLAGKSYQATDSEAYGNNIAVDADFPNDFDSGDGEVGTIGLGYVVNESFRIEGRLGYRESDFNSTRFGSGARNGEEYALVGKLESTTLTVEGFYDIDTGTGLSPYIKGGLGIARNKYSAKLGGQGVQGFFDSLDGTVDGFYDDYPDKTETEFTWNVGLGASYSLNESFTVVGEYQYVSLGDAQTYQDSFTDGFQIDRATAHEVALGLRYRF